MGKFSLRRHVGFTLVELLIVIGIIFLIIAATLPALAKARAMAQRTQCTSNLRSIGQATTLYSNGNTGFLPPLFAITSFAPEGTFWFGTLVHKKYLNQGEGQANFTSATPDVPVVGALACPSEKSEVVPGTTIGWYGSHYGMNTWLAYRNGVSNADQAPYLVRSVQFKRPEVVILAGDGPSEGVGPARLTGSITGGFQSRPAIRHGKYWQAVHLDGHVSAYDSVPLHTDPMFQP